MEHGLLATSAVQPPHRASGFFDLLPVSLFCNDVPNIEFVRHFSAGQSVLHIGSRRGATTFVIAQILGSEGAILGLEPSEVMLNISRDGGAIASVRLGFRNVDFKLASGTKEDCYMIGPTQGNRYDIVFVDRMFERIEQGMIAFLAQAVFKCSRDSGIALFGESSGLGSNRDNLLNTMGHELVAAGFSGFHIETVDDFKMLVATK